MLKNLKISSLVLGSLLATTSLSGFAMLTDKSAPVQQLTVNSIIVKYKDNSVHKASKRLTINNIQLQATEKMSTGATVYQIDQTLFKSLSSAQQAQQLEKLLAELNANPNVKYAVKNDYLTVQMHPHTSRYAEQWHYYEPYVGANLPGAWDMATGKNVIVSVVDTGITQHENLEGQVLPGQNFVKGNQANDDPTDKGPFNSFHGSHVAGTIAANSDSDKVVAGVAWDAKVVPVRVLDGYGSGTYQAVMEGMRWAAGLTPAEGHKVNPHPAQVINLSLGGPGQCNAAMQETVDDILATGSILVVAAGNSNSDAKYFTPASCDGVITVGATDRWGKKASYSNKGETLEIAAPGGGGSYPYGSESGVLSTTSPGNYEFLQGTSMATPHIVGVTALMLSVNPDLTRDQVVQILQETARGDVLGVGLVNAEAAVNAAKEMANPDEGQEAA